MTDQNNKNIMTVCGEIPSSQLGFCQCHEHIMLQKGKSFEINPALCIDDPELSLQELCLYKQSGGNSLVDCQPVGCGRMADVLKEISEKSGVSIVSSTGFHKMQFYPEDHWIYSCNSEELADIFISELQNGMFVNCDTAFPKIRCSAKAGIIKTALDSGRMSDNDKRLFTAAAIASKKTRTPIIVHIEKDSDPLGLLDFLKGQGVAPDWLIFCHMDRAVADLKVHETVAAQGVYLEYDTIGRWKYHSDEREVEIIKSLADAGFENKILLSLDTTRARLKSYGGALGLDYLITRFIPMLLSSGLTQAGIDRFTVSNPAAALARR